MTAGATYPEIRAAVATRLATISGLRTHDKPPRILNVPAAVVEGFETAEQETIGGAWHWLLVVTIYVGRADDRAAIDKLSAYASPNSAGGVWTAVQTAPGGGDVLDAASVQQLRDEGVYEANGKKLAGFQVLIDVYA